MPHDVFVSYSTRDTDTALAIVTALESTGIKCWIAPRDIKGGDVWAQSIMNGIGGARVFVLVFSGYANRSTHVANELDVAMTKGAVIVPFRVEDTLPEGGMALHLRTIQWLDAFLPDRAGPIATLVATVRTALGQPAPLPPQTEFGKVTTPPPAKPPVSKTRKVIESTDSAFHFKLPKAVFLLTPKGRKYLLGGGGALLAVLVIGWLAFGGHGDVKNVGFEVSERSSGGGSQFRQTFRADSISFYENAYQPVLPFNYSTRFLATQTRYVYVVVFLTHETPGRNLIIPFNCTVDRGDGSALTSLSIIARLEPNSRNSAWRMGWGNTNAGTWQQGTYRVECRYGQKVIGRRSFEVL
ncbi:MAG: toll/interleukin-1 receptor domain-containing protein [Gemmatimonadota bacterium]